MKLRHAIERFRRRQRLRYWALVLPLLVIALALPLLRPLRTPDPRNISDDEFVRLEAIRTIAQHGRYALEPGAVIDRVAVLYVPSGDSFVALPAQEPMFSVLGAGVYQLLRLSGVELAPDEVFGTYLLTLILSTLPCAVAVALLYRCARILDVSRAKRMAVAFASIACSGLLAYATVLSPYALASMLAIAAFACVVHLATSMSSPAGLSGGWFVLAGFCAGLAFAVHPSAGAFSASLVLGLLALPIRRRLRVMGVLLFALGALAPVAAHRLLLLPYGDVWTVEMPVVDPAPSGIAVIRDTDDEPPVADSALAHTLHTAARVLRVLLGPFGVLSHAPLVLLAVAAVVVLYRRYWPAPTRSVALVALLGVALPTALWAIAPHRGGERMFGPQPVVAVLPVLLLFAGVFLRSNLVAAGTLSLQLLAWAVLAFSLATGLLGLLGPYPRGGFPTYPPYVLARQSLLNPPAEPAEPATRPETGP